jgi:hypothetical protein
MSGGPVFRLIETGLTRLEFVGIVYEHGETFELVFARSASVVRMAAHSRLSRSHPS